MNEITVKQMAESLGLAVISVKKRLRDKGIKPTSFFGPVGLYPPETLNAIRAARPAHRPPKAREESSNKES